MRGLPNYFNSKEDYMNCLKLYPEETKQALRALMNNRYKWVIDKKLNNESEGITDENHYVNVATEHNHEDHGKENKVIYQMKRVEDDHSKFFELGFTVAEVNKLIK